MQRYEKYRSLQVLKLPLCGQIDLCKTRSRTKEVHFKD